MEAFSTALQLWFDQHTSTSLRDLSSDADITPTDLSRVRAGDKDITLKALTKLLPAIERLSSRSHARALLVAYLHDETPAPYQPDIRIHAIDDVTGGLDRDDITIARDRWEAKARADAEFAKMWLTLDGYMHETDATAVDARLQQRQTTPESHIALLAVPHVEYRVIAPGSTLLHDLNRTDAAPP